MDACPLCGLAAAGDKVHPGPAWQRVHRACFIEWDRKAEAEEVAEAIGFHRRGREPVREALRG